MDLGVRFTKFNGSNLECSDSREDLEICMLMYSYYICTVKTSYPKTIFSELIRIKSTLRTACQIKTFFFAFPYYLILNKISAYRLNKLELMPNTKFARNYLGGSGEEYFYKSCLIRIYIICCSFG